HKSVITTEVPIGVLIKNIFEFNQFEGGEGEEPYEEPRRMDRIRNISLEINNLTTLALSGNENVTDALKNCSCFSCDLNNIQTIIQNNTETFLSGLKTEYQKGIIELNNLKNDIKKLEEAEKALKNNLSNNIISSAKYYYLRDTYTDWEISSVSLFEELEDYGSFASFHYPTSGISKDEFPTIALESNYNWCSKVPVGDAIELSKVVGNKIAERLETLLKLTFLVISHSTALNTFALSYNDEIYKYDSCRGIMPYYDSNFSELTEKFPGLLKGPYDSVELFNLSQHLSRLQKGKTRIDEVCDTIYNKLFYLYNWGYLLSGSPSWWQYPNIPYLPAWFPNGTSLFMTTDHFPSISIGGGYRNLLVSSYGRDYIAYISNTKDHYASFSLPNTSRKYSIVNYYFDYNYRYDNFNLLKYPHYFNADGRSGNLWYEIFSHYKKNWSYYHDCASYNDPNRTCRSGTRLVSIPYSMSRLSSERPNPAVMYSLYFEPSLSSFLIDDFTNDLCENFKYYIDFYSGLYENPQEIYNLCGFEDPNALLNQLCPQTSIPILSSKKEHSTLADSSVFPSFSTITAFPYHNRSYYQLSSNKDKKESSLSKFQKALSSSVPVALAQGPITGFSGPYIYRPTSWSANFSTWIVVTPSQNVLSMGYIWGETDLSYDCSVGDTIELGTNLYGSTFSIHYGVQDLPSDGIFFVKAYVTNSEGTTESPCYYFYTPTLMVATGIPKITSSSTAIVFGSAIPQGDGAIANVGFKWREEESEDWNDVNSSTATGTRFTVNISESGFWTFQYLLTGLSPNTNHRVGSYATVERTGRTVGGGSVTFFTESRPPIVNTGGPATPLIESAFLYGNASSIRFPLNMYFTWYQSNDCSGDENYLHFSDIPSTIYLYPTINITYYYNTLLTNLIPKAPFSYKACATNVDGTTCGSCSSSLGPSNIPALEKLKMPENHIVDEGMLDVIFFGSEEEYGIIFPSESVKKPLGFENIGLLYIIDNILPDFKTFLKEMVEKPMESCIPKEEEISDLITCARSRYFLSETGLILSSNQCKSPRTDNLLHSFFTRETFGIFKHTESFSPCSVQCGFSKFFRGKETEEEEKGYKYLYTYYDSYEGETADLTLSKNYQNCLRKCLDRESYYTDGTPVLSTYENELNFFCCQKAPGSSY
ncbi:MAG: hypothetical protein WCZ99_01795, partial [Candidatus Paceibacterota bacterium]